MHTYLLPWCFAEICSSFIDKSGSVWLAGLWWEESGLPTDWVKGRQAGDEDGGSRHITGPWDRWKPQSTHRWETRESLCALWINHCLSRKLCVLLSKTGTKQLKKIIVLQWGSVAVAMSLSLLMTGWTVFVYSREDVSLRESTSLHPVTKSTIRKEMRGPKLWSSV